MQSIDQIKHALERLSILDRESVAYWLQALNDTEAASTRVEEARPAPQPSSPSLMTLEEFFELEAGSPIRHEFVNGIAYAMSGTTVAHACIVDNVVGAFNGHLRGGPCRAFSNTVKLLIRHSENEISYYPDVIVDCQPDRRGEHFVQSPKLIVEVLSPSTRQIDRREKLQNYRLVDSIEEYAIAEQSERQVTIHRRADRWQPRIYSGSNSVADFPAIGLALPLSSVYDGVR
ncbi:MAG: Uma2 family endonuclease [Steroidobacteraceae bacterium]